MSSHENRYDHGHLDATTGREVVYCHACSGEWYRDEHGLICASCGSEVTEIVNPGNDPRDLDHHTSASTSPELPPISYRADDDSDPEEVDIEEHVGPHGFTFRSSVRDGAGGQHYHDPHVDPVLSRFVDMVQGFAVPRRPQGAAAAADIDPNHVSSPGGGRVSFGQPHIHRTTFSSGPFGGSTSVTIVSGPVSVPPGGGTHGDVAMDPFQAYASPSTPRRQQPPGGLQISTFSMTIRANQNTRMFSSLLRDIGPPGDGVQLGGEAADNGGPPPAFARSLHDILSLISPANAMAGDAVYSQEALDRIITGLMEANPQSNAAPPASEEALNRLERKTVDKGMLSTDEKTECAICIDDMQEGQKAVFLPCKHWFHEECVVLWLKEHNTCPVCRTPIEKSNSNNSHNTPRANADGSQRTWGPTRGHGFGSGPQSASSGPSEGINFFFNSSYPASPGAPSHREGDAQTRPPPRYSRPPSQSQSRINEAFRNISSLQMERDHPRDQADERGTSSGFSYDTSRLQRRGSHSPTSPRATTPGEHGARMRQRSPSTSSRGSLADRDGRRQTSHGPISWLRDRFSGGNGGNPGRDDRRS